MVDLELRELNLDDPSSDSESSLAYPFRRSPPNISYDRIPPPDRYQYQNIPIIALFEQGCPFYEAKSHPMRQQFLKTLRKELGMVQHALRKLGWRHHHLDDWCPQWHCIPPRMADPHTTSEFCKSLIKTQNWDRKVIGRWMRAYKTLPPPPSPDREYCRSKYPEDAIMPFRAVFPTYPYLLADIPLKLMTIKRIEWDGQFYHDQTPIYYDDPLTEPEPDYMVMYGFKIRPPIYLDEDTLGFAHAIRRSSSAARTLALIKNGSQNGRKVLEKNWIRLDIMFIHHFISSRGNEYFCEIDEEYLTDRFNLTGLNAEVQYYQYALDLVTDVFDLDCEDDMREQIEKSARHLYGLVHARYIVTTRGLAKMLDKYKKGDFGKCPRVMCDAQPLLPTGMSDNPHIKAVKLYCCKCEDVYNPKSSRHASVDGAYFGTSFHNILFQVYPALVPEKSSARYEPKVFGFRVHAAAALARWQDMRREEMRDRLRRLRIESGFEGEEEFVESDEITEESEGEGEDEEGAAEGGGVGEDQEGDVNIIDVGAEEG